MNKTALIVAVTATVLASGCAQTGGYGPRYASGSY
jgi:hypothetical protein